MGDTLKKADLNFVYTVVNHEVRKYYVTAHESDLGKADPLNQIGWIYNFNGDTNLVVKVSSFLIDTHFDDREYQMHYETVRFALREVQRDPNVQHLMFTSEAFDARNEERLITGLDLRKAILRFYYDVRSVWPQQGISIFDLCHNFANDERELQGWLHELVEVGYLVSVDELEKYVTQIGIVSTEPFRINPKVLADIKAELGPNLSQESVVNAVDKNVTETRFDVGLSFAGAQRDYVRQVADELDGLGVTCFFDEKFRIELWGKDLAIRFAEIYGSECRHFVPFISKEYVEAAWPNHEFRTALAKMVTEKAEDYILPFRFDNSKLEGLRSTISYIDIGRIQPGKCAEIIRTKVSGTEIGIDHKPELQPKTGAVASQLRALVREFELSWRVKADGSQKVAEGRAVVAELVGKLVNFVKHNDSTIRQSAQNTIMDVASELDKLAVNYREELSRPPKQFFDIGLSIVQKLKQIEL